MASSLKNFLKICTILLLTICCISYGLSLKIFTQQFQQLKHDEEAQFDKNSNLYTEEDSFLKSTDSIEVKKQQYLQIQVTKNVYYYAPLIFQNILQRDPSYISFQSDEVGKTSILLKEEPKFSPYPGKAKYVLLRRNLRHNQKYNSGQEHFIYDVLASKYTSIEDISDSELPYTRVTVVQETVHRRSKRSRIYDRLSETGRRLREHVDRMTGKKVIHLPALFIEEEKDGFQNVFYEELINAALCLTSQPELDRHELVDEYEALLCNKKGYGQVIGKGSPNQNQNGRRRKRNIAGRARRESPPAPTATAVTVDETDPDYHYHDAESAKWHMDKSSLDTLWKVEGNATTTTIRPKSDIIDDLHYDYEYEDPAEKEGNATHPVGWEVGDVVADPSDLDYMTWPQFLQEGQSDDDSIRQKYHTHEGNPTLASITEKLNFSLVDPATVDRKLFALNETNYVATYYERMLKLKPYGLRPLLLNFFSRREKTLSSFKQTPITLERLRQLFILFIMDVHHVNCFNRHIRYYGYLMKKPASINGDEITNGARLARGIIMRALELLRHTPQYNLHKELILKLLIAGLKERAALSKHLTTVIGENDYTELYEVATYLENLLKNGIHPDEKDKDLFVQETRFYSHHFMNTLSL